ASRASVRRPAHRRGGEDEGRRAVGREGHRLPDRAPAHGRIRPDSVSLYLVEGKDEVLRRRALVPAGQVGEAWADPAVARAFWIGEESKRLLDAAGAPLSAALTLPDDSVPVFYGPRLCDIESLPREESVRTRALSARGIAVAWITLDRFGERTTY